MILAPQKQHYKPPNNTKKTHCEGGRSSEHWKAALERSSSPDLGLSEAKRAFSRYILQVGMQKFGDPVTELGKHKLPWLDLMACRKPQYLVSLYICNNLFTSTFSKKAWMNIIYSLSTRIKHFFPFFPQGKVWFWYF